MAAEAERPKDKRSEADAPVASREPREIEARWPVAELHRHDLAGPDGSNLDLARQRAALHLARATGAHVLGTDAEQLESDAAGPVKEDERGSRARGVALDPKGCLDGRLKLLGRRIPALELLFVDRSGGGGKAEEKSSQRAGCNGEQDAAP